MRSVKAEVLPSVQPEEKKGQTEQLGGDVVPASARGPAEVPGWGANGWALTLL